MLKIDIDMVPGGRAEVELAGTIEQLTMELNYILSNVYCDIRKQNENAADLLKRIIAIGSEIDDFWTLAENADNETLN